MRKRLVLIGLSLALLFIWGSALAKNRVELASLPEKMDLAALGPLLEKGEITLVSSNRDGGFKQGSVICLVAASPAKTWNAVTDYEHYAAFMPNVARIRILKREGSDAVLAYELDIPGPNFFYTLRHHHTPPTRVDIWPEDDKGDIRTGCWRWELFPYAGGRTILVYHLYTDVRESSWILRQALKADPSMEHGLNVATGLVTVRAVKRWAER